MTIEKKMTPHQVGHLKALTQVTRTLRRAEARTKEIRELQANLVVAGRAKGLSVNNIAKAVELSTSRVGQLWQEAERRGD